MFTNLFFWAVQVRLGFLIVVMIVSSDVSEEVFPVDVLTALKPSLEYSRKCVLRLLRLYGDQAFERFANRIHKYCRILY